MADHPGDQTRMTDDCPWRKGFDYSKCAPGQPIACPNTRTLHEDWDTETIGCDVCGIRYKLYDDEMC